MTTGYQGNINLKAKGDKEEFTPQQIQEIVKCKNDPVYFIKNYINIINLDKGLIKFDLYNYQEGMIEAIHTYNRIISRWPRQCGKSTTVCAYFCHYILFNKYKTVGILANKESTARELLGKIKLMIEYLPSFLKPGVIEWNKGSIYFDNDSKIITAATSSSACRGFSFNCVLLDEFSFITEGVFEDFIQSVYPTISSSKKSKIIMVSTPNGMNHFYKFWREAEKGRNGYFPVAVEWNDPPGRDEAFKQQTIDEIGEDRWKQEFECSFSSTTNTLVNGDFLKNMVYEDPIKTTYEDKFKIYETPKIDRAYMLICDVAEGIGGSGDYSTIQVLDVTEFPHKQVAIYRDNTIKPMIFSRVIAQIGNEYNKGLVIVENNTIGMEVLNNLNYNEEYDNIFFDEKNFGLRMTKGSKSMGCSYLKDIIENKKINIINFDTIKELTSFTKKKNGTYSAENKKHDDLITPLIHYGYFISKDDLVERWLDKENILNNMYENSINKIDEELLPIGIFPVNYYKEND